MHEHESHYVYDLLHNNTTDIKPERHSTDTHGSNQVNFWILRVFGYQFVPRYRDLLKKIDGLSEISESVRKVLKARRGMPCLPRARAASARPAPGAASRRPNGSAEREIPFLSNKENGENRRS